MSLHSSPWRDPSLVMPRQGWGLPRAARTGRGTGVCLREGGIHPALKEWGLEEVGEVEPLSGHYLLPLPARLGVQGVLGRVTHSLCDLDCFFFFFWTVSWLTFLTSVLHVGNGHPKNRKCPFCLQSPISCAADLGQRPCWGSKMIKAHSAPELRSSELGVWDGDEQMTKSRKTSARESRKDSGGEGGGDL